MKKNEQQMTYETPEVEAIEVRIEHAITDSQCVEELPSYHDCTGQDDL